MSDQRSNPTLSAFTQHAATVFTLPQDELERMENLAKASQQFKSFIEIQRQEIKAKQPIVC